MSEAPKRCSTYPDPAVVARWTGRLLSIEDILDLLPHRPPFLLVDRITELEPSQRALGVKGVTMTEPWFVGHYPGHPVMPGVLIIEALAQVAGIVLLTGYDRTDEVAYFTTIKDAKFREPVRPGDQLLLDVRATRFAQRFGRIVCWMTMRALVEDRVVAEADCSFALVSPG